MIQGSVDQVLDLPSRALPSALPPLLAQVELEQTLPLAWPRLAILIVSVNRLVYIKSLNDFRDFFYS